VNEFWEERYGPMSLDTCSFSANISSTKVAGSGTLHIHQLATWDDRVVELSDFFDNHRFVFEGWFIPEPTTASLAMVAARLLMTFASSTCDVELT